MGNKQSGEIKGEDVIWCYSTSVASFSFSYLLSSSHIQLDCKVSRSLYKETASYTFVWCERVTDVWLCLYVCVWCVWKKEMWKTKQYIKVKWELDPLELCMYFLDEDKKPKDDLLIAGSHCSACDSVSARWILMNTLPSENWTILQSVILGDSIQGEWCWSVRFIEAGQDSPLSVFLCLFFHMPPLGPLRSKRICFQTNPVPCLFFLSLSFTLISVFLSVCFSVLKD